MAKYFCCPQCGNRDLQAVSESITSTTGSNYSASQGCCGLLLLGPLGLLCGLCGKGQQTTSKCQTYWYCNKCGKRFESPDDIRKKKIDRKNVTILIHLTGFSIALFIFFLMLVTIPLKVDNIIIEIALSISVYVTILFVSDPIKNKIYYQTYRIENEARELESDMAAFFESNIESNNNPIYNIPSQFPIRCTNCNAALNNNAHFCTQCGMHIETTENPSQNNV